MAILQAIRAMERCDLVILMIDAPEGVAEQDAKIAGLAVDRGRAMIVVLNKSDLLSARRASTRRRAHPRGAELRPVCAES